jgi:Probable cobalt transporter subunit (CbtA)/FhuF 2Fe-2S C-terminal domain
VKYPANPPSIGHPETIQQRGGYYLLMVLASVSLLIGAVWLGQRLKARFGTWNAALLAGATLGPYFAIEAYGPRSRMRGPWQPLSTLLGSPREVSTRIGEVRESLAVAAGRPAGQIEFRAAASVAQLGIAARLICPVFGSAVLGAELPIDIAHARWVPTLGGPFPLSLPETAFSTLPGHGTSSDPGPAHRPLLSLLGGPIGSLVEITAAMAVSRRTLWGNVASAINGAAAMVAVTRPELTGQAAATSSALLHHPALAASYNGQPITSFQRRSCCLIYRLATSPPAEYCGDCILPRLRLQT